MRAIKKNMKEQVGTSDKKILHCPSCDAEYSGNAGDYFLVSDDHIFMCDCGTEMELVDKVVTIKYV